MHDDEWDVEEAFKSPLDTLTLAKNRCVELLQIIKEGMQLERQNIQYMRKMLELAHANFVSVTDARLSARSNGVSDRDIHALLGDLPLDALLVTQELNQIVYN